MDNEKQEILVASVNVPANQWDDLINKINKIDEKIDLLNHEKANETVSVEQAAKMLKCSALTVYKFIRRGKLKAVKIGKTYNIKRKDVEAKML